MNIQKTNPWGLEIIKALKSKFAKTPEVFTLDNEFEIPGYFLSHDGNSRTIKITKKTYEASQQISFKSIVENFSELEFAFTEAYILMHSDDLGIVRFKIVGTDVLVLSFNNEGLKTNIYSFENKEWFHQQLSTELEYAIKILIYLFYGEIDQRFIPAKGSTKLSSFSKFLNNSTEDIYYANSLWKQRISTEGFKVSGHFRLQPIGEKRKGRKLIWIEEFKKEGYNRKATIENFNENNQ